MSQVEQAQTLGLDTAPLTGVRPARVNLLPPEIEQARRLRRTQTGLAFGLAAVVVVIGGAYALQVHAKNQAAENLATVKAETVRLQAEQARYADVPKTISAIDAAENARSTAMANDVEWFRTLNDFSLTVPSNVWFTSLNLNLTPPTAAAAGTPAAASTAPTGVGSLSVAGTALAHTDVATWLDVLAREPGMGNAYFSNSTKSKIGKKAVVNFSSTAVVTSDALSHRYDRKQG